MGEGWSPTSFFSAATNAFATDPSPPPPSNPTKMEKAIIKGRVQGVFYMNWTLENVKQLGLKGWMRNRRDGSVEALFSGDPDSVNEMEQRCRCGHPDSMVNSLQVFLSDEVPGPGFDRRQTV
ncbi:acylphosphatase-like [Macadamia integrifolia]|uniref:acylphosphatase-like n=1 Tax=Macadamia integrifolia TaxID=60698 RepID=UPI001C4E9CDA|nr:acylphosphatase-like [Macadamia integrifolia]